MQNWEKKKNFPAELLHLLPPACLGADCLPLKPLIVVACGFLWQKQEHKNSYFG